MPGVVDPCGTSRCGVYVHDLENRRHVFVDEELSRVTGFSREELLALDAEDLTARFHPEDRARVAAHLRALRNASDGDVLEIRYRFRRRDGGWADCLSRDRVLERGPRGEPTRILGRVFDIDVLSATESLAMRMEECASRDQQELELIYAHAPIGICVLDGELRYLRINAVLAETNGLPPAAHLGKTVREILPDLADTVEPLLRQVVETGEPVHDVEVHGETPARPGVHRTWVESWLPLKDRDRQVTGIMVIAKEITDERQALRRLREANERWRMIADYTYDWEYWVGRDGHMRWVSPSCRRITGYSADAFLADPGLLQRLTIPEDAELVQRHLQGHFSDCTAHRMEFRIRRADGAVRWMEHICQPVYDRGGRFAGRRASTRDVTDTKAGAAALAQRERELATLTAQVPDIIARFDPALRHLYVNDAIEAAIGRKPQALIGRAYPAPGLPEAFYAKTMAAVQQVFARAEPVCFDLTCPAAADDGAEHFYRGRAVPELAADGTVESVVCAIRDDTALYEAEALAARLAAVVETSKDFIGLSDLEGRTLYLNSAGKQLVGLNDMEAVRETRIEDYLLPEDLPRMHDSLLPAVLRDGSWSGDFRFRHFSTGAAIDVNAAIVRIDDPVTGQPTHFATVTRDIREQKATQAALIEADRRKDQFLAVLGHELRNPMAPIRNAIELLKLLTSPDADRRIRWAIEMLDRQSAHLTRLLDDLLDVSRIVRGKLALDRNPVRLRDVVEQAVDGVRPLVQERGHRLEIALPDPAVLVFGDPVRLVQILLNVLLNAATYTPQGGRIEIDWEAGEDIVRVQVRDNGPGIPADQLEALFAPFARGRESGTETTGGGLGLGLTISRRLAELHGGRLEATDVETGSTLQLVLPRHAGSAAAHGPAARKRRQPTVPLDVLVVEDNPDVAEAMVLLLQTLGHRVEAARSGPEALDLVGRLRPALAFVDIGLPGMDGLEVGRRLRERLPATALRLVALTGFGHQRARERSLAAGFDEHIAKPVDRATLERVLARAGASGDASACG